MFIRYLAQSTYSVHFLRTTLKTVASIILFACPSFSDVLTNGKLILVVVYITTILPFSLVSKT